jgi:hypothetical protein
MDAAKHELVNLRTAGKLCRRDRSVLRKLIESGRLRAFKVGECRRGGKAHPWLQVYADEAVTAVERASTYVPASAVSGKRAAPRAAPRPVAVPDGLDPMLARLLTTG